MVEQVTFGTLLDTFKGFFSRGFWFANFLPVVLVVALHSLLATQVYGVDAASWLETAISDKPGLAVLAFAGLVVLAYALGPLTPLFGGLVDGSLLPRWLHDQLRADRAEGWRIDDTAWRQAFKDEADARRFAEDLPGRFEEAVAKSRDPQAPVEPAFKMKDAVTIQGTLHNLEKVAGNTALLPSIAKQLATLEWIATQISAALGRRTSLTNDTANATVMKLLGNSRKRLIDLAVKQRSAARQQRSAVSERLETYDPQTWQATRLGDVRYALRRYARDTYNVDFGYLWPRVRMAFIEGEAADSKGVPRQVADAAAQVDFAVALLALSCTVPMVWLFLIITNGGPIIVFVCLSIATPIVLRLYYELIVRSELAFGTVARTAIDRYRLSVFGLLSLPLPATFSAERELWAKLAATNLPDTRPELVFAHGKADGS